MKYDRPFSRRRLRRRHLPPPRTPTYLDFVAKIADVRYQVWSRLEAMRLALDEHYDDPENPLFMQQRKCCKVRRVGPDQFVALIRENNRWRPDGVVTCKSALICPRCGRKVATERAAILSAAMDKHRADGGVCLMLTLTFPHARSLDDSTRVKILRDSWDRFQQLTGWRRWKKQNGVKAVVRAFDATYTVGQGVHPHFHILLALDDFEIFDLLDDTVRFSAAGTAAQEQWCSYAEKRIFEYWESAVLRQFRRQKHELTYIQRAYFREHGARVDRHDKSGEYLTKWGMAIEIAGSAVKRSQHPFALLDTPSTWPEFRSYAKAIKGQRFLTGLTEFCNKVGINKGDQKTIAAAARETLPPDEKSLPDVSVLVMGSEWKALLRARLSRVFPLLDCYEDPAKALEQIIDDYINREDDTS